MLSFVETKLFTRLVQEYLADDEYAALQAALIADPKAGVVIPGSGANCVGRHQDEANAEATG